MYKIRVQTIDGEVDYYDIRPEYCYCSASLIHPRYEVIREEYYPEYRLDDLLFSFVWVGDE